MESCVKRNEFILKINNLKNHVILYYNDAINIYNVNNMLNYVGNILFSEFHSFFLLLNCYQVFKFWQFNKGIYSFRTIVTLRWLEKYRATFNF